MANRWTAVSAWDAILRPGIYGADTRTPGVTITPRKGLAIASVIGAPGRETLLAQRLRPLLGVEPPTRPRAVHAGDHCLLWAGPGQWLALAAEQPGLHRLAATVGDAASIADQSASRAILRLSGRDLRAALAKGCMVDLHSSALRPGDAALTSIAYVGVHLWRVDDGSEPGTPTIDVAVPRSMAGSFWSWLSASAAEFGYEVKNALRG